MLLERAPAKVNLTLHLLRRRSDGFHDLESLVAFSRAGDLVGLEPGEALSLTLEGPTAGAAGLDGNLVLKAAEHLRARVDNLRAGRFHLVKRLPVAAGIGGGSSDAAAALRLLARLNGLSLEDSRVMDAAAATGSDVPVCLGARARVMRGSGLDLGPVLDLPPVFALLVNPGVALATKDVFREIGWAPGEENPFGGAHPQLPAGADIAGLVAALKKGRNDMEDAASVLAPVIGHVLAVLGAARGVRLARMSGSGATCFALFETRAALARATRALRRDHPGWWVKAAALS